MPRFGRRCYEAWLRSEIASVPHGSMSCLLGGACSWSPGRFASCSSDAIGILLLTVRHLLAVMARVEFHEAHAVLHGHRTEDGSHPLAVRGGLAAGLVELLVRRLEANASLGRRRGPARGIHRLVGLPPLWERCLPQYSLEEQVPEDEVNDCGKPWKL